MRDYVAVDAMLSLRALRITLADVQHGFKSDCGSSSSLGKSSHTAPCAILDAGGDVDTILSGSLHRHIGKLADGQTLEVLSRNIDSRTQIPMWCRQTGHILSRLTANGDETIFWIQKMGASSPLLPFD
jgi:TusA-related sulfurtransferase